MLPPGLPSDTLGGHRTRFYDQYKALKKFYNTTANMQFFKNLIRVPHLPEVRVTFVLLRAVMVLLRIATVPVRTVAVLVTRCFRGVGTCKLHTLL